MAQSDFIVGGKLDNISTLRVYGKNPSIQSYDLTNGGPCLLMFNGDLLLPSPSEFTINLPLMSSNYENSITFIEFRNMQPGQTVSFYLSDEDLQSEQPRAKFLKYLEVDYPAPAEVTLDPGSETDSSQLYILFKTFADGVFHLKNLTPLLSSMLDNSPTGIPLLDLIQGEIKGLTSLDTSVVITDNGDSIDFSVPGSIPFFQKDANFTWFPVNNTTQNLDLSVQLKTNTIGQYTDNCLQAGGFTNSMNNVTEGVIVASDNCIMHDLINPTTTAALKNNFICSSNASTLQNLRVKNCSMLSCDTCSVTATAGAGSGFTVMAGCKNTTAVSCNQVLLGVTSSTLTQQQASVGAVYLGVNGLTATGVGAGNFRLIHGNFTNGSTLGTTPGGQCILMDSSSTGPAQNFATANTMITRYVGGTTFYTNTAFSQGVTLAPGASAWASVCDVNKKNILGEIDYLNLWGKLDQVPVNIFTYIGDERARKYIGPTAQDFHGALPISAETFQEEQFDENGMLITDENGNPVTIQKLKKDTLVIDTLDYCGSLLTLIKAAKIKIEELEARVAALENPVV